MTIRVFEDTEQLASAAAEAILDTVKANPYSLLCFATGNSPVRTYQLLTENAFRENIDFTRCRCIGLDEWVQVPRTNSGTCYHLLREQLFIPLGIKESQILLFDGMAQDLEQECSKMNSFIQAQSGVDCIVVGIGTNGHIGFNEPGVDMNLQAHVQDLHESTVKAGAHYFSQPTVISRGITLGMTQVLGARKLLLLANGKSKAAILRASLQGIPTRKVPASFIQQADHAMVLIDKEAASELYQ